jgi:hypothetical protein
MNDFSHQFGHVINTERFRQIYINRRVSNYYYTGIKDMVICLRLESSF